MASLNELVSREMHYSSFVFKVLVHPIMTDSFLGELSIQSLINWQNLRFEPTASDDLIVCRPSVEIPLSAGFDLIKPSRSRVTTFIVEKDCNKKANTSVIKCLSTSSYVGLHKIKTLPTSQIKWDESCFIFHASVLHKSNLIAMIKLKHYSSAWKQICRCEEHLKSLARDVYTEERWAHLLRFNECFGCLGFQGKGLSSKAFDWVNTFGTQWACLSPKGGAPLEFTALIISPVRTSIQKSQKCMWKLQKVNQIHCYQPIIINYHRLTICIIESFEWLKDPNLFPELSDLISGKRKPSKWVIGFLPKTPPDECRFCPSTKCCTAHII